MHELSRASFSALNKLIQNAQLAARGNVLWGMRFAFILHAACMLQQTSDHKVTQHHHHALSLLLREE